MDRINDDRQVSVKDAILIRRGFSPAEIAEGLRGISEEDGLIETITKEEVGLLMTQHRKEGAVNG